MASHDEEAGPSELANTTPSVDPGNLFRRHISQSILAARSFRDRIQEAELGEELIARLPTLARRTRRIQRDRIDRRKNVCLRVRFTALDKPDYQSSAPVKYDGLLEKGLGRRADTTVQLPLDTDYSGLVRKARELFPVLEDVSFDLLLGRRQCRFEAIEETQSLRDVKEKIPKGAFARIWVRPRREIPHVMMGTPTVLGRQQGEVSEQQIIENQNRRTEQPTVVTEQPTVVTEQPTVVIEQPTEVTEQPTVVNEQPTVITEQPTVETEQPTEVEDEATVRTDDTPSIASSPGSLHLELDLSVEDDLQTGFARVRETIQGEPQTVFINRDHLMANILSLYSEGLVQMSRPIRVEVEGESGEDLGGMTEDMFSQFWDGAFSHYFHGNEVYVPFIPPNRRAEGSHVYPTLGKVLEHMVSLTGRFPARMARTGLLVLCDPDQDIPTDDMVQDYLRFLPTPTSMLLQRVLASDSWRECERRELTLFFSANGMSCLPSPRNIRECLGSLAQVELMDKPASFYRLIRRGISPMFRDQLLGRIHPANVDGLFDSYRVCPDKLVEVVMDSIETIDLQPLEQIVSMYFVNVIRELSHDDLTLLVRWVTGSSVMPQMFKLIFNGTSGLTRAPVAHTCGNVLELPTGYNTYKEFKDDLIKIIHNEEAWKWTTI